MNIPESWTFKNSSVADGFDAHVREQLPWYELAQNMVAHVAALYMPDGAKVYDIGASTGNLSDILRDKIDARQISWTSIDNSREMGANFRGYGELTICDALKFKYDPHNLSVLFLSLMFFSVPERKSWLQSLYDKLLPGGALIIVDKQEPSGGTLQTEIHRFVMKCKAFSGASADDIIKKEFSLSGIQNPLPRNFFDSFKHVTEIFRMGDFAAWVIEKKE